MKITLTNHKKTNLVAYVMLFILVVLAARNVTAQRQATNWYFGNKSGINLENVTYTMSDGALVSNASCASICEPTGDLRMYTNGNTIWNAKHLIVANGTEIEGNPNASQGTIIIPVPTSNHMFYVFTAPANGINTMGQPDSLRYTIVDMSANGGMGAVETLHKNIAIYGVVEEKLTAVYDANGVDVWIIAHGFKNDKYVAYKLTQNGLEGPVVSTVGLVDNLGGRGCMKAAPNGAKIARALTLQNKVELVDFNNVTGVVSNSNTIANLPGCYGVEFSSFSSRLYVTTVGVNQNYINQFDLKQPTHAEVVASKFTITPPDQVFPTALQLGYNGILYMSNAQSTTLGKIQNADTLANALSYSANAINLSGTTMNGLPSFVQSYFLRNPSPLAVQDDAITSLSVYPNPSNGIFRLDVGKNKSEDISLNIFNMTGTKIYSVEHFDKGVSQITIDLSGKPAGVYFFDMTTSTGKTVKRLVIN